MININNLILDFDGVIVNSIKSYCEIYNKKYKNNTNFKFADYTKLQRWDCKDECPLEEKVETIFSSKEFFIGLQFMPNAKEIIYQLSKYYNITICSIGTFDNISYKSLWLKNNLSCIKSSLLITNTNCFVNKSIINMKDSIFIDDNANNLKSSNAPIKICFGKIMPYNKEWESLRADNWEKTYQMIVREEI